MSRRPRGAPNGQAPLAGRVAVVTGAGRGLGRSHAVTLAAQGAAIVVNDVGGDVSGEGCDPTIADAVVAEIEAAGGAACSNTGDVSSFAACEEIIGDAVERFGRIDIVVNNAGIAGGAPVTDLTEELLTRMLGVHFLGTVGMVRAALPEMRVQGYGRIVNTVSEAALDSRHPADVSYGGAKGAVWAATLAMAREVAGSGVTVNGLSPGARTRMSEDYLGARRGPPSIDLDPQHVSRVVAALVSESAADINGKVIHAAGGAVREYRVSRSASTDLVTRLVAQLHD